VTDGISMRLKGKHLQEFDDARVQVRRVAARLVDETIDFPEV